MKSVVICGSRRFKKEIRSFAKKLRENGIIVYEPILNTDRKINSLPSNFKYYSSLGLTHHQFEMIKKADILFVFNKNGYIR